MIQQNFNTLISGIKSFLPFSDLRRAQLDIFEEFLSRADENLTKGFFDLATGFGKTRMMNVLTESYLSQNPNGKVVVVVPTVALIKDENGDGMIKRFQDFHQMYHSEPLSIGSFYTDEKDTTSNVIVTTYTSLNAFVNKINPDEVGLLLLDEAHHSLSERRIEAIKSFQNACCYGLTATPAYSPDKNLESLLGSVISEMNTVQAVKDGLLTPCKNVLLSSKIKVDLTSISKIATGEYNETELGKVLSQALKSYQEMGNAQNWKNVHELIANEIAVFYQNYVDETIGEIQGKKCMINCRSQAEAKLQARALNKLFGRTVAGTWTTNTKDKTILNRFVNGDLPVLCQVGKLSEGFDMPNLDICINYPTCSRVVEAQRGGRVLRLNPENENKFALIVDVVFSHPDFDNPILSSHVNGQVLYRDITNESVIRARNGTDENNIISFTKERNAHISMALSLEAFDVFSSVEELITLENDALSQLVEQNIPLKREGMLTVSDLMKLFKKSRKFFADILEKCYQEAYTFEVDDEHYPLVEKVKSNSYTIVMLNEHPNALEKLKKILFEVGTNLDISQKREGMRTCGEMAKLFGKRDEFFKKHFEQYHQERQVFEADGMIYPLIEEVRVGNNLRCLVLHEHPLALEIFKKLVFKEHINLDIIKREGMKTANDLGRLFRKSPAFFREFLEEIYQKNIKFKIGENAYSLVEQVQIGNDILYALHEQAMALEIFKTLLFEKGVELDIPMKRKGMKTAPMLGKILHKGPTPLFNLIKKYYLEGQTFEVNGISYPLIEKVRNASRIGLLLHEHPKALEKFKILLKKDGINLDNTQRTQKVSSQKRASSLNDDRQKD